MIVRNYEKSDLPTIEGWHESSGFPYVLPDFEKEPYAAGKVVFDGERPVAAAMARVVVEIYGFCEKDWGTPGMRLAALKMLHASITAEMRKQKIKTAFAWVPPSIRRSFARRMSKTFGWIVLDHSWQCITKDI